MRSLAFIQYLSNHFSKIDTYFHRSIFNKQFLKCFRMGFGAYPYDAHDDHYDCPKPTSMPMSNNKANKATTKPSWWALQWEQTRREAEVLEQFSELKPRHKFSKEEFEIEVENVKKDEEAMWQQTL